jgi:hypothetical protein
MGAVSDFSSSLPRERVLLRRRVTSVQWDIAPRTRRKQGFAVE